jgi:hypothetical protein
MGDDMTIDERDEMRRRMAAEYAVKAQRQAGYYEFIMDTAKENPVEGAYMLCSGLMRGNRDHLQMGYSLGSALAATLEQISLTRTQIGSLVEMLAVPRAGLVEYGPTSRA